MNGVRTRRWLGALGAAVAVTVTAAALAGPAAAGPILKRFVVVADQAPDGPPSVARRTAAEPNQCGLVVWAKDGQIRGYDLGSGAMTTLLPDEPGARGAPSASIVVLCEDFRANLPDWPDSPRIYSIDPVSRYRVFVSDEFAAESGPMQTAPSTHRNSAVWEDWDAVRALAGDADVHFLYFPTWQHIVLDPGPSRQREPVVWQAPDFSRIWVAWIEEVDGQSDVRAARLAFGGNETSPLRVTDVFWVTRTPQAEHSLDIDHGVLVYARGAGLEEQGVYAYDLAKRNESVVRDAPAVRETRPAISWPFVVYEDQRADADPATADVLAVNLTSRRWFPVAARTDAAEYEPDVSGGAVAYRYDAAGYVEDVRGAFLDSSRPDTFAPRPAAVRRGVTVALYFKVADTGSAKARVTLDLRRSGSAKVVKSIAAGWRTPNRLLALGYRCTLPRGTYRFTVTAMDEAGNLQRKAGSNVLTVK